MRTHWGALIVAILALAPATAAIEINSSQSLKYYGDGPGLDFQAHTNGTIDLYGNVRVRGNNITGFFAGQCSNDQVVAQIYEDGSYKCVSADSVSSTEDLNDTLSVGNSAGDYNISMNGNDITAIRSLYGSGSQIGVRSNLSFQNQYFITNLRNPVNAQDAATKDYVDNAVIADTDDQNLQYGVPTSPPPSGYIDQEIGIENGANITFRDYYNPNQSLGVSNNEITLDGGGGSITAPYALDADKLDGFNASELDWPQLAVQQSDIDVSDLGTADAALDMGTFAVTGIGSGRTNITATGSIEAGATLDMSGNDISNFFGANCGTDQYVERVWANGTYKCGDDADSTIENTDNQNLSEVLVQGNVANMSIDMSSNSITNIGDLGGTGIVDGTNILDGSVGTSDVANAAITADQLAKNAVNRTHIGAQEVTSSELNTGVTGTGLSGGAGSALSINDDGSNGLIFSGTGSDYLYVNTGTGLEIASDAVGIADSGVGSDQIAAGAVNTTHILDGTISSADFGSNVVDASALDNNGDFTVAGLTSTGDVQVQGDLDVWGNITNTDVQNLNVNGSILPPAEYDNSFDLGSASRRWADLYLGGSATIDNGLTVSAGTVSLPTGAIDNTELANNDITITAGNHLTGGGSVELGGSTTLDVSDDWVDIGGDTMQGNISFNDQYFITNLRDPANAQDAATKSYVDSQSAAADTDQLVAIDNSSVPGFLGNTSDRGVLRTDTGFSFTDSGDYITLGLAASSAGDGLGFSSQTYSINTDGTLNINTDTLGVATAGITADYIAAGAVNTTHILDSTITAADIGSDEVGSSEIAAGAVGNTQLATDAVGSTNLQTGAVIESTIANGAVNTTHLQDSAVTGTKIASDTVTVSDIAPDTITASEIASGGVDTDEIATDAVTSTEIATGAVGSSEIADYTIGNSDVALGAINKSQLGDSACSNDEILKWDNNNNEWVCDTVSNLADDTDDQTLSEVLVQGNVANMTIDMDTNDVTNIGTGRTNITATGKIEAGADIDAGNNNIDNVNTLNSGGQEVQTGGNISVGGSSPKIDMGNGMSMQRNGDTLIISDS